ncbi:HpcH/HpaI aldolase family protein [Mangrovihabitans endophyticus]|uniref:Aldolase n=1 Tax=Mangrovihabitans endophyticus TaxID=1751298 RepID=A0A8J3BVU6_9ACTN|nr:aldolase/citrate lyase family protein [Mangrovihabitans endophyticus]GGK73961.1 aldolase [Mangrovihabitans endophyticus]
MSTDGFAARLRDRQTLIGYWMSADSPVLTERIATVGYDYVGVDGQHGVPSPGTWPLLMMAVDAGQVSAGVLRVPSADPILIGAALDAGARAVVVPMVDTPQQAAVAARACRHWPHGTRSLAGPVRAELRMGSVPAALDEAAGCIVMIETAAAYRNLAGICATPGVDAVYIGPADLTIALGGRHVGDPEAAGALERALKEVAGAAAEHGVAAGIHCPDGRTAAARLAQGFTFATVSSDVTHLHQAAAGHLAAARSGS